MEEGESSWLKPSGEGWLLCFRQLDGREDELALEGFSAQQASSALLFLRLWRALRAGDSLEVDRVTKEAKETSQLEAFVHDDSALEELRSSSLEDVAQLLQLLAREEGSDSELDATALPPPGAALPTHSSGSAARGLAPPQQQLPEIKQEPAGEEAWAEQQAGVVQQQEQQRQQQAGELRQAGEPLQQQRQQQQQQQPGGPPPPPPPPRRKGPVPIRLPGAPLWPPPPQDVQQGPEPPASGESDYLEVGAAPGGGWQAEPRLRLDPEGRPVAAGPPRQQMRVPAGTELAAALARDLALVWHLRWTGLDAALLNFKLSLYCLDSRLWCLLAEMPTWRHLAAYCAQLKAGGYLLAAAQAYDSGRLPPFWPEPDVPAASSLAETSPPPPPGQAGGGGMPGGIGGGEGSSSGGAPPWGHAAGHEGRGGGWGRGRAGKGGGGRGAKRRADGAPTQQPRSPAAALRQQRPAAPTAAPLQPAAAARELALPASIEEAALAAARARAGVPASAHRLRRTDGARLAEPAALAAAPVPGDWQDRAAHWQQLSLQQARRWADGVPPSDGGVVSVGSGWLDLGEEGQEAAGAPGSPQGLAALAAAAAATAGMPSPPGARLPPASHEQRRQQQQQKQQQHRQHDRQLQHRPPHHHQRRTHQQQPARGHVPAGTQQLPPTATVHVVHAAPVPAGWQREQVPTWQQLSAFQAQRWVESVPRVDAVVVLDDLAAAAASVAQPTLPRLATPAGGSLAASAQPPSGTATPVAARAPSLLFSRSATPSEGSLAATPTASLLCGLPAAPTPAAALLQALLAGLPVEPAASPRGGSAASAPGEGKVASAPAPAGWSVGKMPPAPTAAPGDVLLYCRRTSGFAGLPLLERLLVVDARRAESGAQVCECLLLAQGATELLLTPPEQGAAGGPAALVRCVQLSRGAHKWRDAAVRSTRQWRLVGRASPHAFAAVLEALGTLRHGAAGGGDACVSVGAAPGVPLLSKDEHGCAHAP